MGLTSGRKGHESPLSKRVKEVLSTEDEDVSPPPPPPPPRAAVTSARPWEGESTEDFVKALLKNGEEAQDQKSSSTRKNIPDKPIENPEDLRRLFGW